MQITPEVLAAAQTCPTPCLIIDPTVVRAKYHLVRASLADVHVFYAVKANPHPRVLQELARQGCGFEVSSVQELTGVLALGVTPDRIISSNPVKAPDFIALAYAHGVRTFAYDSTTEIAKLARWAPGSRVYVRLAVDNTGSDWPLSRKYGVDAQTALALLDLAAERGLEPCGLTFHVGSQCLNPANWENALRLCAEVWQAAASRGLRLSLLNLGGGLPVRHLKPIPALVEIGQRVTALIRALFPPDITLIIEPGRALVGDAAVLVASVIGKAVRGDEHWLYLDAGVFNALMETIQGFGYELWTERTGPVRRWTVAGPSCDSVDVLFNDVALPELEVGDRLYVLNAGAYTLSYASSFNGFPPPAVFFLDELLTTPAPVPVAPAAC